MDNGEQFEGSLLTLRISSSKEYIFTRKKKEELDRENNYYVFEEYAISKENSQNISYHESGKEK